MNDQSNDDNYKTTDDEDYYEPPNKAITKPNTKNTMEKRADNKEDQIKNKTDNEKGAFKNMCKWEISKHLRDKVDINVNKSLINI